MPSADPFRDLYADLRRCLQVLGHQVGARALKVELLDGQKVRLPVPPCSLCPPPAAEETFIPNDFQAAILEALDGKALRTDALGAKVANRSRLFQKPGALPELRERGLVDHHSRLGYYRPDAPPAELAEGEE